VFVTGATGYIGEEVALGLSRAGHQVFGLVRDRQKAATLLQNEVHVVVGNLLDKNSYAQVASECEVVIHTAADFRDPSMDKIAVTTLLAKNKVFIYTSGILVYGHSTSKIFDENDLPQADATGFLRERIMLEQQVITNPDIYGVVVRPSFVFGRKSRHFYPYFQQALQGRVIVSGPPHVSWSEIHIDDLVDFYVRVVEAAPSVVAGHIFNLADMSRYTNLQIATAFAAVAGFTGRVEIDEKSGFEHMNKTVLVDSSKAMRLLGWRAKHPLLLDPQGLARLFTSWQARALQAPSSRPTTPSSTPSSPTSSRVAKP